MNEAMGRDWADILEGMPKDVIGRACIAYLRSEPKRKPAPGAIYALAQSLMPLPALVPMPRHNPAMEVKKEPRVTPEMAAEIMQQAGFRPRKFGGSDAD